MNKIYKSKWGQHFDLSRIFSVSKIYNNHYDMPLEHFYVYYTNNRTPLLVAFEMYDKNYTEFRKRIYGEYDDLVNAWIKYKNQTDTNQNK